MATDSFNREATRFAAKLPGKQLIFIRRIGAELFRDIMLGTPVDTGHLRNNWQVGINRRITSVKAKPATAGKGKGRARKVAAGRGTGGPALGAGIRKIQGIKKPFPTIYITNNLPYAVPIEEGHSSQAPSGMVRRALLRQASRLRRGRRKL